MIQVKFICNHWGGFRSIEISGHANFAEYGKDIVCAGVSALVETALLGLKNVACLEPKVVKKSGYVSIFIAEDEPIDELQKADVILQTLYLGIEDISKTYPQNIRIQKVGGVVDESTTIRSKKRWRKFKKRSR